MKNLLLIHSSHDLSLAIKFYLPRHVQYFVLTDLEKDSYWPPKACLILLDAKNLTKPYAKSATVLKLHQLYPLAKILYLGYSDGETTDVLEYPLTPQILKPLFQEPIDEVDQKTLVLLDALDSLKEASPNDDEEDEEDSEDDLEDDLDDDTILPGYEFLYSRLFQSAHLDLPILLEGESGTGKEVMATFVHEITRFEAPFIKLNCAAIPENLMEAELFGYEKGAFTGAEEQRQGKLELADGGDLFLDEVNSMPLVLQAKFLRALQDGCFFRLGGTEPVHTSARVIAASNQNLQTLVQQGLFRRDLYYRLRTLHFIVPPLRFHKKDLHAITRRMMKKHLPDQSFSIDEAVMDFFWHHDWPGNLRELDNVLQCMIVQATDQNHFTLQDVPLSMFETSQANNSSKTDDVELKDIKNIRKWLQHHNSGKSFIDELHAISEEKYKELLAEEIVDAVESLSDNDHEEELGKSVLYTELDSLDPPKNKILH